MNFENEVTELLELYPDLEELFEVLDITPQEVIEHLLENGLVELPPFLEREFDEEEYEI